VIIYLPTPLMPAIWHRPRERRRSGPNWQSPSRRAPAPDSEDRGQDRSAHTGRPSGARNKATLAAEALFDSEAEALSRRRRASWRLGGSEGALRLCLDRIIAPRRERPIQLAVAADPRRFRDAAVMGAIVEAAARGSITARRGVQGEPDGRHLVRAIETSDFDRRLQILENADAEKAANALGWNGR
jgi:hypothetical protein